MEWLSPNGPFANHDSNGVELSKLTTPTPTPISNNAAQPNTVRLRSVAAAPNKVPSEPASPPIYQQISVQGLIVPLPCVNSIDYGKNSSGEKNTYDSTSHFF
ncbi:hypothetical protein PSYAE_26959, partial [Pseudomonas amygdali pv. aesculi str. 0893_23]